MAASVSIVIAHYNRLQLLANTLVSIRGQTMYPKIEIIVVDDGSVEPHLVAELCAQFGAECVLSSKVCVNPAHAYNLGLKRARGDIVIIQNAECKHLGDVVGTAVKTVTPYNYVTFSALNSGPHRFEWYNHPEYRPSCLHFCSAITRDNIHRITELTGHAPFDERFYDGICFDDDDFLRTIKYVLALDVVCLPPERAFVIHQTHPNLNYADPMVQTQMETNRRVFRSTHDSMMELLHSRLGKADSDEWQFYADGTRCTSTKFTTSNDGWTVKLPTIDYTVDSGRMHLTGNWPSHGRIELSFECTPDAIAIVTIPDRTATQIVYDREGDVLSYRTSMYRVEERAGRYQSDFPFASEWMVTFIPVDEAKPETKCEKFTVSNVKVVYRP